MVQFLGSLLGASSVVVNILKKGCAVLDSNDLQAGQEVMLQLCRCVKFFVCFCAGVLLCVDAGFAEAGVDGDSPIDR